MARARDDAEGRLRPGVLRAVAVLAATLSALGATAAPATAADTRIAFTWSRGGEAPGQPAVLAGVASVRADGTGRRLVARGATEPHYSPDGRRIAFLRGGRLWVARADGRSARAITRRGFRALDLEWSRQGTWLAVVRRFSARSQRLYRLRPDGSRLKRLARATRIRIYAGAWSRDGQAIVFESQSPRNRPGVYVARVGSVRGLAIGAHPAWSRFGLIAYETAPLGAEPKQVCLGLPGYLVPIRCMGGETGVATRPRWYPDGRRLMHSFDPAAEGDVQLRTVRVDGVVLAQPPLGDVDAAISSASTRIAFVRDGDLYTATPLGTFERRIVRDGEVSGPDWQPPRVSR